MASDNEQDQHSIWNGRFKANPKEAKFFLEIVDKLGNQFDGMPIEEILQTFWGEPRDVLDKLIKKANKREKKEEAKFDAKTLKRAPGANILFQKDYKTKCDAKGIKFDLKTCAEEYKKLSDKDKAKYQKESLRLKEEYNAEYARLRGEAIKNGDFPEDKPKRPLSGFLRYLADVREEITEKYKDVEDRKKVNAQISKDAGEMWNALSDKEKEPYEIAYKKEKEAFEIKHKEWESKELERRKKNGAEPATAKSADVKIETAGSTKKAPAKASAKAKPQDSEAEAEAEEQEEPVKAPATTTKKASAKAPAKAKPQDSEAEAEEQEEPVKAPATTTKKASAKTPAKASAKAKQQDSEAEAEAEEQEEPVKAPATTTKKASAKAPAKAKPVVVESADEVEQPNDSDVEIEVPKPKAKAASKAK